MLHARDELAHAVERLLGEHDVVPASTVVDARAEHFHLAGHRRADRLRDVVGRRGGPARGPGDAVRLRGGAHDATGREREPRRELLDAVERRQVQAPQAKQIGGGCGTELDDRGGCSNCEVDGTCADVNTTGSRDVRIHSHIVAIAASFAPARCRPRSALALAGPRRRAGR